MEDIEETLEDANAKTLAELYKLIISKLSENEVRLLLCKYYALVPSTKSYEDIVRLSNEVSDLVLSKVKK